MAKVVITFDTVDKMAEATIDGAKVDNFKCAHIQVDYDGDDYSLELGSGIKDKDNAMHTWTRVCAADSTEQNLITKQDDNADELNDALKKEVSEYFLMDD